MAYREIDDLRLGHTATRKDSSWPTLAWKGRAATISLVIDQERNLPGGTWYVFGRDDFLDLFNDLPAWKLRQKLRVFESTAPQWEPPPLERQKEVLQSKALERNLEPTSKDK